MCLLLSYFLSPLQESYVFGLLSVFQQDCEKTNGPIVWNLVEGGSVGHYMREQI